MNNGGVVVFAENDRPLALQLSAAVRITG